MNRMTSRERFARMYAHREADRIPIIDSPWGATIERWQKEGMPEGVDYTEYFDLERVVPVMKQNGGYIFSSDHSVPSSVSLEDFRAIVALAKKLGSY